MKRALFAIAQIIWGLPQTLLGLAVFLAHVRCPHFVYHGAIATRWSRTSSVSLGLFVFVSDRVRTQAADQALIAHEFGHCIQSLIFGPAYLVIMGLPSFVWAMLPALQRWRTRNNYGYYHFYTERLANYLSSKAIRQEGMH